MTILYRDPVATFGKDYVFPLSWLRLFLHWHGSLPQRLLLEVVLWTGAASVVIATKAYVGAWPAPIIHVCAALVSILSSILTFMLGFYTSTVYSRWWTTRTGAHGGAQLEAYNIAMQLTQCIYDDEDPVAASRLKQLLMRWCCIPFGMLLRAVYTDKPHVYSTLDSMARIGLATPVEADKLDHEIDRSTYTQPIMWMGHLLTRLREDGHRFGVTEWMHYLFIQEMCSMRGDLGWMFTFWMVPVPLIYKQLVNAAVRVYVIAIVLLAGDLGLLLSLGDEAKAQGNLRWVDLLFVVVIFFVYVGWLHVAEELANPYRISPDGLDYDDYVSSLRVDVATMVDDHRVRLPTVESIANEPLPGDSDWNAPTLWRDHTHEWLPGLHQWTRQPPGKLPRPRQLVREFYDTFREHRLEELEQLGDHARAALHRVVHPLAEPPPAEVEPVDDTRLREAQRPRRRRRRPWQRIPYLGM
ncbi:hypothetical protein CDCA_CDCA05G1592 [Cyanidium caldarium]|uniref:Bestrophin n=1 Tax=Cyanidium caldarium TaxID=2771 RepID=A0AAV9ITI3_CYACA|nr:hypothetical protein CDCA_CDCA05G1592 [Cyanidium caldarium]